MNEVVAASPSALPSTNVNTADVAWSASAQASEVEMPADYDPFDFGLLPGDEYIVTSGALKGQRGFFTRDDSGEVVGADLAGRLFTRLS